MTIYRLKRIFWTFWDRKHLERALNELRYEPLDNYLEFHHMLNSHKYPFLVEPPFYKKQSTRSLNLSLCLMNGIELVLGNREYLRAHHINLFNKGELHYMITPEFDNNKFNEWYEHGTNKYMALKCIVI